MAGPGVCSALHGPSTHIPGTGMSSEHHFVPHAPNLMHASFCHHSSPLSKEWLLLQLTMVLHAQGNTASMWKNQQTEWYYTVIKGALRFRPELPTLTSAFLGDLLSPEMKLSQGVLNGSSD